MAINTYHAVYREANVPDRYPEETLICCVLDYNEASKRMEEAYLKDLHKLKADVKDSWCSRFHARILLKDGFGELNYRCVSQDYMDVLK